MTEQVYAALAPRPAARAPVPSATTSASLSSSVTLGYAVSHRAVQLSCAQVPPSSVGADVLRAVPAGLLMSPGLQAADGSSQLPTVSREPVRCATCGGFLSMHCQLDESGGGAQRWACCLCGAANQTAALESTMSAELQEATVEYSALQSEASGPVSPRHTAPGGVAFVIDLQVPETDLRRATQSICDALGSVAGSSLLTLVTFGRTASVYDLSLLGVSKASAFPGISLPDDDALEGLLLKRRRFCVPASDCAANLQDILKGLRSDPPVKIGGAVRAVGVALELARALLRGSVYMPATARSRCLLLTGGAPSFGPGSMPTDGTDESDEAVAMAAQARDYFEGLASNLVEAEVEVSTFCIGNDEFALPLLSVLSQRTGGVVALHSSSGATAGGSESATAAEASGRFASDVARVLGSDCAHHCTLDIRTSEGVAVSQLVGPVAPCFRSATPPQWATDNWCRLTTADSSQAIAIVLDVAAAAASKRPCSFLQLCVSMVRSSGQVVRRVCTQRLPHASSAEEWSKSIDPDVVTVLLAKRAVLAAHRSSQQQSVGYAKQQAAQACAQLRQNVRDVAAWAGASRARAVDGRSVTVTKLISTAAHGDLMFPRSMAGVPRQLFLLERGPLLGRILQHADDISAVRSAFLSAPLHMALTLIAPKLYFASAGDPAAGSYTEVGADTLSMQSERVLFMDAGTEIFVWHGIGDYDKGALLTATRAAQAMSCERLPAAEVMSLKEHSSMARWLLARVIPAHKDPAAVQREQNPNAVGHLGDEQLAALARKFIATDDETMQDYLRSVAKKP